jgi:pilus assembly protein FimV
MPMKKSVKAHKKPRSSAWKILGAAAVSAAIMTQAHAVGLGQLNVLSALGQPLQAEIELTSVSRDEAGSLAVKLASPEAFRQANIEYNPALQNLRFSVDQRNGRPVIRVTSSQPISEPFVDLLIEVSSRDSRLVREYVVLLDPVGSRRIQSAESTPAPSATASAAQKQAGRPAAASATPAPASGAQGGSGDSYTVKRGDTLASIAGQFKREGVSLDQMLVAMQRANPSAFVSDNMNRLRSGQILNVPSGEAARGVDTAEAHRIVVAQANDFNSYRNRLASQVAAAPGQQNESGQIASGRVGARVEEQKNPASESRDRLQVSRSGTAASATDAEDRIAKDKALAEANSRVAELEKTVNDLQKLLEIRNRDLAARQNSASAAPAAGAAAAGAIAAAPAAPAAAPVGNGSAGATPAAAPTPPASSEASSASAPVEKPAPAADKPKPKPIAKPAPAPTPAPEPGFLESLGSNPTVLGGGALVLALLAALGVSRSRAAKKKKVVPVAIEPVQARQESSLKANSLFGAPGGQNVDTSNSVFNSHFSPSASQLDTNEVDPVAEADVYIAYGRDAQAEEILKEALRNQPDRTAVRAKLLEIYANRKDLRAFEATAAELHAMTKGQGEEWEQAASLGANLDPTNPLYASGKKPAGKDEAAAAGVAGLAAGAALAAAADEAKKPEDEFDLDALLNTTQGPIEAEPAAASPQEHAGSEAPVNDTPEAVAPDLELPADVPAAEAPQADAAPHEAADEDKGNLLDFDFDLSSFGKTPPEVPESVAAEADDSLMDFDLGETGEAPKTEAQPEAEPNAEEDFPSLDASLPPTPSAPQQEVPDPADFDLSGISLDLDTANADPAALDDVPVLGASAPNAAEMATKLDLASAYQEIGDREGARELLEEVIKGGTADQSEKAKAMLEKLT